MKVLTRTILLTAVFALFGCTQMHPAHQSGEETSVSGPYQATGFKIGEVSATDALVWARLTRSATRVSDEHADGWSQEDVRPEHRYLNVVGGFLTVTTERSTGAPALILRHHDVDGNMLNEDRLVAN